MNLNRSNKRMLTGNKAAAWGARLAGIEYVPAFPITPQTEIVETLAQWFADGTLKGKFTNMDSEHSMYMAAGSAAARPCFPSLRGAAVAVLAMVPLV